MKTETNAAIENLYIINNLCEDFIDEPSRNSKSYNLLMTAIEEIFVNISSYAYQGKTGKALFEIEYIDKNKVRVIFTDSGKPFNPLEFDSENNAKNSLETLTPGGLGIQLVKSITENLCYKYENGKNILSFEKTLEERQ